MAWTASSCVWRLMWVQVRRVNPISIWPPQAETVADLLPGSPAPCKNVPGVLWDAGDILLL